MLFLSRFCYFEKKSLGTSRIPAIKSENGLPAGRAKQHRKAAA
jgi:hypothetical protein